LSSRNMTDKTMCEVLWRNISDFYVNLRVEVAAVSRNIRCWKNCWYLYNIDKCNKILCLSSRNMIDKTMCEVLWRNIFDFYVNLRVEVGTFYVRFLKIFYSETTGKFTLAMYFYLGQEYWASWLDDIGWPI
jgi:hypothetical protein